MFGNLGLKKKFLRCYLFLCLFAFYSCADKSVYNDLMQITIDWKGKYSLSEIADYFDVDTIKLETSALCLINNFSKVQFFNDRILVYDSRGDQLLIFASDGRFLNRIGQKGMGPQEYIGMRDFYAQNGVVHLYDFNQKKILSYTLTGDFLSSVSLENVPHFDKIYPLKDGGYVTLNTYSNTQQCPKFGWLDSKYNLLCTSRVQRMDGTSLNNVFCDTSESVLYWEMMNDTIYSLKVGEVVPLCRVNFSRYSLPDDIVDVNEKIDYYSKHSSTTACFVNNVIDTERFFSFTFVHDFYTYWVLLDKETQKQKMFRLARVGEWGNLQYVVAFHDGNFIGVLLPDHDVVDDNPYLLKLKLKD